jgi:hypothetical protein
MTNENISPPGKGRAPAVAGRALLFLSTLSGLSTPAFAQSNPKFEYGKPDDVKVDAAKVPEPPKVEWRVQAKGGALLTTGNSQSKSGTFGLTASRKEGNNKLALDGAVAYGRSSTISPVFSTDPTMANVITGIERPTVTTVNNWFSKGRYDRFFTTNNSGYASAQAAADQIAGKTFFGGGQIGYSRQLVNTPRNVLVAELGYDYSYERYLQQAGKTIDPVSVHSARIFAGETLKLSATTGLTASVEALFNLNTEGKALNVDTGQPGVDAFKDTRINGKVSLSTNLHKQLSIAFGFTLRYDQNPAPLPLPAGLPAGDMYATNFLPFADKVDTLTEATLIYTFL